MIAPDENASGVVYGVIIIGALLAAESGRHESYPDSFASAAIAAALYWLAHAYATVLGRRLTVGARLTPAALARALAHDWAIMRGAGVPLLALLLCWLTGASQDTAVTVALWSVVAALIALEIAAGLRSRSGAAELVLEACVGAALGIGVIALRALLH